MRKTTKLLVLLAILSLGLFSEMYRMGFTVNDYIPNNTVCGKKIMTNKVKSVAQIKICIK